MEVKANKRKGNYHSKFTPETIKAILDSIAAYVPYQIAAQAEGVAPTTFFDWMAQGIFDLTHQIESGYADLARALGQIANKRVKECTEAIISNDRGHHGAQWLLERAFWKYFSSKVAEIDFEERLSKLEQQSKQGELSSGKIDSRESEETGNA